MGRGHEWISAVTVILKLTNSVNEIMFTMGILTTLVCQLQRYELVFSLPGSSSVEVNLNLMRHGAANITTKHLIR